MRADPETERAVLQSLREALDHYGKGDTEAAMRCMVDDDDIVLVEPGPDQFWVGRDEVRRGVQLDYETTEGDIPVRIVPRAVSAAGDVARVSGDAIIQVTYAGRQMIFDDSRFTGIALRQGDRWRWHTLSFGLMNPDMEPGQQWAERSLTEAIKGPKPA